MSGGFLLVMENSRFGVPFSTSSGTTLREATRAGHETAISKTSHAFLRDAVIAGVLVRCSGNLRDAAGSGTNRCSEVATARNWNMDGLMIWAFRRSSACKSWEDSEGDDHQEAGQDVVTLWCLKAVPLSLCLLDLVGDGGKEGREGETKGGRQQGGREDEKRRAGSERCFT